MKNFSNVGLRWFRRAVCVLCAVCFLSAAGASYAEAERYDFPKENPVKFVTVAKPKADSEKQAELRKLNEAKRQSIAALLSRYNKKLGDSGSYEYANMIIDVSDKFGQNPFIIASMVVLESSARNDAVSRGGDYGLMQVRWRVHQKNIRKKYPQIETAKDMFNPKDNLTIGTEIFSGYYAKAKQDVRGAIMYYTSGNRRYADKLFKLVAQLEKSYQRRLANLRSEA